MTDWNLIKHDYITGHYTYDELGKKYGIKPCTVGKRANLEGWRELKKQLNEDAESQVFESDVRNRVKKVEKVLEMADFLAKKIEDCIYDEDFIKTSKDIKNLTSALKDLKDIKGIKSKLDKKEQKARIKRLENEAEKDVETNNELGVVLLPPISEVEDGG